MSQGGLFPQPDGLLIGGCFYCDLVDFFRWDAAAQQLVHEAWSDFDED